ncbi:MAG: DNA replication and repair protein RecF, partial [Mycobacterium sp.]
STLQSFRGSPKEAMVRSGADCAILRAQTVVGDRAVDIEAELSIAGRSRTMVNRLAVRRRADLHDALRTTVFSPEDIGVVRGGPSERRRFLDEALAVIDPRSAVHVEEVEKILRQRAALLRI